MEQEKEEEEEEEDFMSDKFLIPINNTSSTSTLTYSDKRKRKQIESLNKSYKKSRAEQEIEAREEGLRNDLIANQFKSIKESDSKDPSIPTTTHSKAVQMMLKMGFQPGKALGKQPTTEPIESNLSKKTTNSQIQSHEAFPNQASSSHKPLITPIEIKLRNGRGGIGTEKPTKARYQFSKPHQDLNEDEIKAQKEFFEKSKSKFDIRKIESNLSKARRTCQELDLRNGIEENVLWLDPYSDEIRDEVNGLDTDEKRLKGLKDPNVFETTVVSTEEEEEDISDREEKASWLALDSASRLIHTLRYLRQEYFYCIWCGCQYDSLEELNQECPGEDEDDH
ncbi:uncharacterized protein MELLADRAFT_89632 [Melampsora larici-populina 98AG31]|uniref:DUF4187 domain-containing protein n=1 Tax=Melampsora larici-populina (strain 98AG31 / pathotype 3-4-7) TaxID=747676 RepID=F4RU21_MELLP|nr:uncharacterized protein MELLADRAFT_89632 [Melampsora larici-populina 98AG31]EGG04158.1 hypothetical protein MELLADRAFT_89632 [Melampsora larici-populina 98AG31]